MPPYRDPNRLFYAPTDPVMLTREQMQQLSPQELQAATDQLDQHLVFVLQQIEENFAKCNQVVVESLLPAVEQHGENSMRIYESIKFWRPFFEAAASIRLNEPYNDDTASVGTEEAGQSLTSPDRTVSSAGDETYSSSRQSIGSDAQDLEGTPRASHLRHNHSTASSSLPPEPHWSTDDQFASPFSSSNPGIPANSAMKQHSSSSSHGIPDQQLQRLRLRDLPPDSPDVPDPQFETAVFGVGLGSGAPSAGGAGGAGTAKGKGRDYDLSLDSAASPSFSLLRDTSPTRTRTRTAQPESETSRPGGGGGGGGGGDKPPAKLLDKILRKNLASPGVGRPGPGSSTPGRPNRPGGGGKMQFPADLPREWNGIANLSHTALDAFPSPIKRRQSNASTVGGGIGGEGGDGDDSFARMMAAAVPPPSTLRRPSQHPSSSSASATYLTSSPAAATSRPFPPSTSSYVSAASPSRLTRTPAKYAAKLTARHVYESLGLEGGGDPSSLLSAGFDSPPPSIMKTHHRPFDLHEHTQRQQTIRRSLAPGGTAGRGIEDEDEDEGGAASSPTTERRTQSRYLHDPRSAEPTERQEPSFASSSNASIVQPPSFIARGGDGDVSHTQPFNLYQHQHEQHRQQQQQALLRRQSEADGRQERRRPLGESGGVGHDEADEEEEGEGEGQDETEHDIDDILFGGKTMTFRQEQRASLAPPPPPRSAAEQQDFGGIVDDDADDTGGRGYDQDGGRERTYEDDMSYVDDVDDGGRGGGGEFGFGEQEQEQEGAAFGHYDVGGRGGGGGGEDESFDIERGLRGNGAAAAAGGGGVGFGNRLLDGPEDTLFGMPPTQPLPAAATRNQPHQSLARYEEDDDDDDTFTENQDLPLGQQVPARGGGAGFRLHGLSEMETLHGGELLASEPFQASPLAGRWGLGGGTS